MLGDSSTGAVQRAQAKLAGDMDRLVEKQKVTRDAADQLLANIGIFDAVIRSAAKNGEPVAL